MHWGQTAERGALFRALFPPESHISLTQMVRDRQRNQRWESETELLTHDRRSSWVCVCVCVIVHLVCVWVWFTGLEIFCHVDSNLMNPAGKWCSVLWLRLLFLPNVSQTKDTYFFIILSKKMRNLIFSKNNCCINVLFTCTLDGKKCGKFEVFRSRVPLSLRFSIFNLDLAI